MEGVKPTGNPNKTWSEVIERLSDTKKFARKMLHGCYGPQKKKKVN